MSSIANDIKDTYDVYKANRGNNKQSICSKNPFGAINHWMYNYLFPEMLLIQEEFHHDYFTHVKKPRISWSRYISYNLDLEGGFITYPCWFWSEDEILRIMTECGIIK